MTSTGFLRRALAGGIALALGVSVLSVSISQADGISDAHVERGKIVGWPGGDAVIYPTLGLFRQRADLRGRSRGA